MQVHDGDEIMMISDQGKIIRMGVDGIPTMGRNTQGVRLMDMNEDEHVVSVARLADEDDSVGEDAEESQTAEP